MKNDLFDEMYYVFLPLNVEGQKTSHPSGRFIIKNNKVEILEDYHNLLKESIPEGEINEYTQKRIDNSDPDDLLHIVSRKALKKGHDYHNLIPEAPLDSKLNIPSGKSFHYFKENEEDPHTLEGDENGFKLDGKDIDQNTLDNIIYEVKSGKGKLASPEKMEDKIKKAEVLIKKWKNVDPENHAEAILAEIGAKEKAGKLSPGTTQALRKLVLTDRMTGVGNQRAWEAFKAKNKPGTYASLDLNDFGHINNKHGHSAGDKAIKLAAEAARKAADDVGTKHIKLFRSGGDEFTVHAASPQHGSSFVNKFHSNLEKVPAIGGKHKISASTGLGRSYKEADKALYSAKKQKYTPETRSSSTPQRLHNVGATPSFVHSALPEHKKDPSKIDG